jgi:hypothetical protein
MKVSVQGRRPPAQRAAAGHAGPQALGAAVQCHGSVRLDTPALRIEQHDAVSDLCVCRSDEGDAFWLESLTHRSAHRGAIASDRRRLGCDEPIPSIGYPDPPAAASGSDRNVVQGQCACHVARNHERNRTHAADPKIDDKLIDDGTEFRQTAQRGCGRSWTHPVRACRAPWPPAIRSRAALIRLRDQRGRPRRSNGSEYRSNGFGKAAIARSVLALVRSAMGASTRAAVGRRSNQRDRGGPDPPGPPAARPHLATRAPICPLFWPPAL